ncbi:exosortase/archaeosortase family protein [Kitasatospora sp. GAS204B]|uniref:exosortase/archaeosortase family protein n=1 Tax=unclassified Kitasatospora TaxID=2633591 RepID=UPI00247555B0|nr:exosortase/archaeosortase family protein [Kitasatospora sp. GAS204B]MDH6119786.1 exosortase/archaeosortase family protein [Kitasatospora sp. GAS204B]
MTSSPLRHSPLTAVRRAAVRLTGARAQRVPHVVMGALLALATLLLLLRQADFRSMEARVCADLMGSVMSGGSQSSADTVYVGIGTRAPLGLKITAECTVLILLVPLMAAGTVLMACTRISLARITAALAAAGVIIIAANQLRLALILLFIRAWGMQTGYEISHKFVGSLVALAGFALGFLVLFKILGRRPRPQMSRPGISSGSPAESQI